MKFKPTADALRAAIKANGIKARVRFAIVTGSVVIQVNVWRYGLEFTTEAQRVIKEIAIELNLERVAGVKIDVERYTDPYSFNFYLRSGAPPATIS